MNIGIFGDQRFIYDDDGNYYTKGNLRAVLLDEYAKHFDKIYLFFRTKHADLSDAPGSDIIKNDKIEFINIPTYEGPVSFLKHKRQVTKIIEANIDKCDVCILRFCYRISCLAAPIAKKHNKPTIAHLRGDVRGFIYDVERIPFWFARWLLAYTGWRKNYKAVNLCDRVIGTSKAVADVYAKPGRWTDGITDGCTTRDFFIPFRPKVNNEPANIIVVARINYAKNIQQIVRAVAKIHSRQLLCKLTIVGDGPFLGELKRLAAQLGISGITYFPGRINSREELLEYYRNAHIGVLTSRMEGMPSSIIESLASSLPVVCTNLPCMDEIINEGQNGYLIDVDDVDACADRLACLITDESLRERMGIQGHETATRLRTDRQLAKLSNLVEELVQCPAQSRWK